MNSQLDAAEVAGRVERIRFGQSRSEASLHAGYSTSSFVITAQEGQVQRDLVSGAYINRQLTRHCTNHVLGLDLGW